MPQLRKTKAFLSLIWGGIIIPLNSMGPEWKLTSFPKIKPNKVSFSDQGLSIEVAQSSSPIFYKFNRGVQVTGFSVEGTLTGLPEINRLREGIDENDDFAFRLGFIETDNDPPNWINRLFMADWINELLAQFPNQGLNKVRFFTVSQIKNPGTFRIHPKNELVEETVVLKKEQPGRFKIDHKLKEPIPSVAIWIQPDGDGSKSHFNLMIHHLGILTEGKEP